MGWYEKIFKPKILVPRDTPGVLGVAPGPQDASPRCSHGFPTFIKCVEGYWHGPVHGAFLGLLRTSPATCANKTKTPRLQCAFPSLIFTPVAPTHRPPCVGTWDMHAQFNTSVEMCKKTRVFSGPFDHRLDRLSFFSALMCSVHCVCVSIRT